MSSGYYGIQMTHAKLGYALSRQADGIPAPEAATGLKAGEA